MAPDPHPRGTLPRGRRRQQAAALPVCAARVIAAGQALCARERALIAAEEELREGQLKLAVVRKEIERGLPPTVSIANLLESERTNAMPAPLTPGTPAAPLFRAAAPPHQPHTA